MPQLTPEENRELRRAIRRLNAQAWGVSFGVLFGLGLFAATMILVIKGGPNVGQHLNLLAVYFPGYRVSAVGAFIGFIYAFVLGYALGRLVGLIYFDHVDPKAGIDWRIDRDPAAVRAWVDAFLHRPAVRTDQVRGAGPN